MMGVKQKESKLFYNFSLSSRIPKDHFLRKLDEAIDFNFIHKLSRPYYSHTGQPSIDPVVLLKMMLIGYLYNITSERKLARELRVNLAFMYFLGYDLDEETPNHSVLSKARRRFGNRIFEDFFEQVVERCKEQGLIEGDKAYIDSTLIRADASLRSIIDCEEKIILRQTPQEYMRKVEEANPSPDNEKEPPKKIIPNRPESGLKSNKFNDLFCSKTDPDASIITHKNKPPQLCYKQHISVDSGPARIITACATTTGAVADEHKLPHLVSKNFSRHDLLPKEAAADTKYGTADNYRFLLESDIKPSIPHHGGKNPTGLLPSDSFTYEEKKDVYICPQGKELTKRSYDYNRRHYIYRCKAKICNSCPQLKRCTRSKQGRSITRHILEEWIERALIHLKTKAAQATLDKRKEYVETVFACEKKDLGLAKAKFRGLINVGIQSLLTATAYNLKKLIKYSKGYKKPLKEKLPTPVKPLVAQAKQRLETNPALVSLKATLDITKSFIFQLKCRLFDLTLAYERC